MNNPMMPTECCKNSVEVQKEDLEKQKEKEKDVVSKTRRRN